MIMGVLRLRSESRLSTAVSFSYPNFIAPLPFFLSYFSFFFRMYRSFRVIAAADYFLIIYDR